MKLKDVKETVADVEVTVDPEFQDLLPALTDEQFADLQTAVERDGRFVDTIKVWGEYNTIIDGHHRYRVWSMLPEDTKIPPPPVERMDHRLDTRDDVILWMMLHQLGQRNLTDKAAKYYRGKLYNMLKGDKTDNLKQGTSPKRKSCASGNEPTKSAAEQVAKHTGSSQRSVQSASPYSAALDRIGQVNPKAKHDIINKNLKVSDKDVEGIGKLPTYAEIGKAIVNVRKGNQWDHGLNGQPVESGNGQQTGNGQPAAKRQPSASTTAKKSAKPATPAAIMKPLKTAIGAAGRELNKAEKVTGGEGVHSRKVRKLLDDALAYVAETWQKDI